MKRSLLPSVWRRGEGVLRRTESPLFALHDRIDRMFDDFSRRFHMSALEGGRSLGEFNPTVDVREDQKGLNIKAELPGLDEKNVEVVLVGSDLRIKGEKKEERREEKGEGYWLQEAEYGSFDRVITLPEGLNAEQVEARFKNGVLNITIPWQEGERGAAKARQIAIKAG